MWAHGDAYQSNPETVETMMDIVHGYIFDIVSQACQDMRVSSPSPILYTDDPSQTTKTIPAKLRTTITAFPSRNTINTTQTSPSPAPPQKTSKSQGSRRTSKGREAKEEDAYDETKGGESCSGCGVGRVGRWVG
jgi:hypothetical protein